MKASSHSYRPDIDGLRAVAIVPVVLYHANFAAFPGGFVGVDVFFVISGFLITSIVAAEIDSGTFTLSGFYERRIRRLMPTLFAVLVATLAAGFFLMTPTDFASLNKSASQTLLFVSNFHFARLGGYFDQPLELAPLLHTWSLAVEEQFYIVWPPLLWALTRYLNSWRSAIIVAFFLLSLALAVLFVANEEAAAFYWPHVRAWELLAGAALALGMVPRSSNRLVTDAASLAGLAMIAITIFAYSEQIPFPGIGAIPPVVGAALLIWSSMDRMSIGGRLLSFQPFVFIGLISYALYLWHWPLFSLFRGVYGREPDMTEVWSMIALSVVLATLCWHFLEKPIRRRKGGISAPTIFKTAAAGAVALGAFAIAGEKTLGFIGRFPPQMQSYTREAASKHDGIVCKKGDVCLLHKGSPGAHGILVWGDSHAGALVPVFEKLGRERDATVYLVWLPACPPLLDVKTDKTRKRTVACATLNDAAHTLIKSEKLDDVVMVARWNAYLSPIMDAGVAELRRKVYVTDPQSKEQSIAENHAVIRRALDRTTKAIRAAGAQAWVMTTVPDALVNVPNMLARAMMRGEDPKRVPPIDKTWHHERSNLMFKIARDLDQRGLARTLDPSTYMCSPDGCAMQIDGRPLYYDDDHLSTYGALNLRPLFAPVFAERKHSRAPPATSSIGTSQN
ncbi:MAG: acyltransferase [Hyphomicrobiaceae bacterium]|nr:acyltransferase [Hyphomicrobiaceae bacterium]